MDTINTIGPIQHLIESMIALEKLKQKKKASFSALTQREKDVLILVAEGHTSSAIAEALGISRVTVQNHRASIRQKLNINTEADYVKYALAYDLISF